MLTIDMLYTIYEITGFGKYEWGEYYTMQQRCVDCWDHTQEFYDFLKNVLQKNYLMLKNFGLDGFQ